MANMHLEHPMAPIVELGEMQHAKRTTRRLPKNGAAQPALRYAPLSTPAVRVRRRRRSSRDGPDPGQRRCRMLFSVMAATSSLFFLLRYLVLPWSRSKVGVVDLSSEGSFEGFWDGVPLEADGARLRREVASLESVLLRKKELLGVAPGDMLEDLTVSSGVAGDGLHGHGFNAASSSPNDGTHAEHNQPSIMRGQPDKPHAAAPKGVAGQPMFGLNPVRQSLESHPNTIREPVPLIVGGTDGSGTRAVVALLQRLKVPMVVEDGGTMDIHGAPYMAKMGWPAVVQPVIEWAHGAGYDTRSAPEGLRSSTFSALEKLRSEMKLVRDKSASRNTLLLFCQRS